MARLRAVGGVALLAVLCISACGGGGGGTAADDATPTMDATPSSPTQPTTTGPTTSAAPGPVDPDRAWVPWGPDDPPIPGQYAALAASPPNCDEAAASQPDAELWDVAVAVCRAITEGGPWPATTRVPSLPDAPNEYQRCLDQELARTLASLLEWHAKVPDQLPRVSYASGPTISPCQARIYDIRVGHEVELGDRTLPASTTPVEIIFPTMQGDTSVTVDGEMQEVISQESDGEGLDSILIFAPAAGEPRTVKIEVHTPRGTLSTEEELPAVAVATTTTTTTTTKSPTSESGTKSPTSNSTAPTTTPPTTGTPTTSTDQ
jgi:hypothetical protein